MHLVFLAVLLRSLASIFAKKAALTSVGLGLYGIVVNVWFLAEVITLVMQALVWVAVLSRIPLSLAYPVLSLVFALNLFAAWWVFDETVLVQHVLGVFIIIVGVLVLNPARN